MGSATQVFRPSRTALALAVGLAVAMAGLLCLGAGRADAYVYWMTSNQAGATIHRAKLDGSSPTKLVAGLPIAAALAVDTSHMYWSTTTGIGRANLNGTGVEGSFLPISGPGGIVASSIVVDSSHIYFADAQNGNNNTIARVNLDGSGLEPDFINAPAWSNHSDGGPSELALGGGYIYWYDGDRIGRANLDGSGIIDHYITSTGGLPTYGFAFDGTHFYWSLAAQAEEGSIARVNADGSGINKQFISHLSGPMRVAVYGGHLYWTDLGGGTRRANLDGSQVTQILNGFLVYYLAFDAVRSGGEGGPGCTVPRLTGSTVAAAREKLRKAHCSLGKVTKKKARGKRGRVLSQRPAAGSKLPADHTVSIVIGRH